MAGPPCRAGSHAGRTGRAAVWGGGDGGVRGVGGGERPRLQHTCRRLIGLSPLLGSPEYEPLTRGIQAALPFVDDFLPVHNLASLEELAKRLAEMDRARRR